MKGWKLTEETKNSKHFENGSEYLTLIPASVGNDKFHIIIEDEIVANDVENLMFLSKKEVIDILKFDPWSQ